MWEESLGMGDSSHLSSRLISGGRERSRVSYPASLILEATLSTQPSGLRRTRWRP